MFFAARAIARVVFYVPIRLIKLVAFSATCGTLLVLLVEPKAGDLVKSAGLWSIALVLGGIMAYAGVRRMIRWLGESC